MIQTRYADVRKYLSFNGARFGMIIALSLSLSLSLTNLLITVIFALAAAILAGGHGFSGRAALTWRAPFFIGSRELLRTGSK
jgi:hypothetical protein